MSWYKEQVHANAAVSLVNLHSNACLVRAKITKMAKTHMKKMRSTEHQICWEHWNICFAVSWLAHAASRHTHIHNKRQLHNNHQSMRYWYARNHGNKQMIRKKIHKHISHQKQFSLRILYCVTIFFFILIYFVSTLIISYTFSHAKIVWKKVASDVG